MGMSGLPTAQEAVMESELERLDPFPSHVKLSTGFELEIRRLKTRQFFRLLKVLTHGAGPLLMQNGLDFTAGGEDFAQRLIGMLLIAIPDAENEFIQFVASMCEPSGVIDKPDNQLSKQQREDNKVLWDKFNEELGNPDPVDTIEILEAIIRREAPEMQALGKRLQAALSVFTKTGQAKETKPETPPAAEELTTATVESSSSEPSPEPSTSSAGNTDGQTSTSMNSLFAVSGSA